LAEIQGYATIVRIKFAECLIFSGAVLVWAAGRSMQGR